MIFGLCCLGMVAVLLTSCRLFMSDFGDEVILGMLLFTFALPGMLLLMCLNWSK